MTVEKHSCPYKKHCGGCSSIGEEYSGTLADKEARVRKLLKPYVSLSGIVGMENPYYYRNKVHRSCGYERIGRKERHLFGIYSEGSHRIVPVQHCFIEDRKAQEIIDSVIELARSFRIRNYEEDTRQGLLRHILVRTAHATGQVMVVLVLSSPVMPGKNNFVKELRKRHPEITTIVINVNGQSTSMVLGDRESAAFGKGYIEDILLGQRFRISSRSFYQVNSIQTEKLYQKALELAQLTGRERVLDAYCGIGTIGMAAAGYAGEVIGVELNPDAVRDARENAKRGEVKNIAFYVGDAGEFMLRKEPAVDVLFMDPPRSGCSRDFLQAAVRAKPARMVYISCNPETLARDLGYLTKNGYACREGWAYDMFAWTKEVETVVSLIHQDA